jgi:hypothetical protein
MACFHPLKPFVKNGGGITFKASESSSGIKTSIPCGQCVGCRLEQSRQWAIRCVHESKLHEKNSFITLTYSPEHLPKNGSLNKKHFQLFMKRLRKKLSPTKIRFFHCGEYGEKLQRPHYHAILFNCDFPDQKFYKKTNDVPLYTSQLLEETWGKGFATVGDVTFESAAYVARYVMKKINGELAEEHYQNIDQETGEILQPLQPEYTTMSRKPGIAYNHYQQYKKGIFPSDEVILLNKGTARKMQPPKYYTSIYQREEPENHAILKLKRKEGLKKHSKNNTIKRLAVRETLQLKKLNQLIRHKELL